MCASTLSAAVCTAMDRLSGDAAPLGRRHEEAQEEEDRAVSNEALEIPPAPPAATEPADPPTPERKQMKRVRLPQSPGMKKVKAAAYAARKAALVAKKAWKMFEKKSELSDAKIKGIWARIWAIEREWKKAAKWDNIRYIQRVNKAELQIKDVEISVLREQVVAFALEADARDTEIAAKEARIARLSRLLHTRSCKLRL